MLSGHDHPASGLPGGHEVWSVMQLWQRSLLGHVCCHLVQQHASSCAACCMSNALRTASVELSKCQSSGRSTWVEGMKRLSKAIKNLQSNSDKFWACCKILPKFTKQWLQLSGHIGDHHAKQWCPFLGSCPGIVDVHQSESPQASATAICRTSHPSF